jgi:hypothetical protein
VPSLFRRKATEVAEVAEAPTSSEDVVEPATPRRGHTPSKKELGKVTPKRSAARRVVEPPPANRREAARRLRDKQRQARAEAREGMRQGKEEYLFARDKGTDRALVRDIVDSRRNVASYVIFGFFILIFTTSPALPAGVRVTANLMFYVLLLAVVLDSMVLARKVKTILRERFPKDTIRKGTTWYAIMRSLSIRRLRIPSPRVKLGEKF